MSNISEVSPETICRFCLLHPQQAGDFFDINQEKLVGGSLSIREVLICCTKLNMTILDVYNMCCNKCFSKLTLVYEFVQDCKIATETLLRSGSFPVLLIDENGPSLQENQNTKSNDYEKQTDSFQDGSDESQLVSPEECKEEKTLEEDCLTTKFLCRYCKDPFKDLNLLETHISNAHPIDRPYTCPICSKGFQSVSNRNTHIQSHNPIETYKCPKCLKSFRSKVYLSKHTKFVHSVAEKKCKICSKIFINSAKYKYHAKSHDVTKQFHCRHCNKSFIQIHHLQNHERTHTGVCPFLCPVCGHRFKAACNLKLHMRVHSNDRKFFCNICSKSFVQQSSYKTHLREHSSLLKEYLCECGKSFKQKSTLSVHLQTHNEKKQFKCHQCEKLFSQRHQLTYHIKTLHTQNTSEYENTKTQMENKKKNSEYSEKQKNILPYICTICDKRFKVPSSLLSHTRVHTEERKHSCDKCNAKFKRREHLRIHVNGVHLKLKPFKCDICARTFSQSGDRNIHMKSHSEEKEHSCTICEKKFRLVKALRTHLRIHTGEKPYTCTFCQQSFMTYMAMAAHTEKCHAKVSAGRIVDTSNRDKNITMVTLPSTRDEDEIQSIEIPASILLTL